MYKTKFIIMVALFISATFFTSCNKEDVKGPHSNSDNKNMNIPGADLSVTRLEMPHLNSQYDYICHRLSNGDVNYTIEYDKSKMHARWVAYSYDSRSAQKNWGSRTDEWAGEPFYDNNKEYQLATTSFYSLGYKEYARGHIVGSAERYYSREANAQTFYMSNMSPMLTNFNSIYWGEIEDKARDNWGRKVTEEKSAFYGGTLYIVKGGSLEATKENPNPIMRTINVKNTLGGTKQMAVPRYYFIACLFVAQNGAAKSIGFWVEHKDYNNQSNSFLAEFRRSCACSINELEARTGLDFFCNLNDNVEEAVESTYNITQWSGL